MIDLQKFAQTIEKCEALAQKHLGAYRLRVGLLAILGISVVGTAFLGAVLLVIGIIAFAIYSHVGLVLKLAVFPLVFAFMITKSMWTRFPPPSGVVVDPRLAPGLTAEIADIRSRLRSLKVHRVLIQPEEFNAGVVQIPILGPLGWSRNYLVIGLPLLEALTREQFRAVVAHELGHLSRGQARFRNWIYRSRQMWVRLSQEMGRGLLEPFLRWFGPYFNAYSFVLARANEYDADRAAAKIAGAVTLVSALTAVSLRGGSLRDGYWQELDKRAVRDPNPPEEPFLEFLRHMRELSPQELREGLKQALAVKTSLVDTHPCLADRVLALGCEPALPEPVVVSAGEAMLGGLRDKLIFDTNRKWADVLASKWHLINKQGVSEQWQLKNLRQRRDALSVSEMYEMARLVEQHEGRTEARPWLEAALARDAIYAPALFMRGRLRLADGDEAGIPDLEEAMRLDQNAVEPGSKLLFEYFSSRRDIARSQKYFDSLTAIQNVRNAALAERVTLNASDRFAVHDLSQEALAPMAAACAANPRVKQAWVVRKVLVHFPEHPLFVLVADAGWPRKLSDEELKSIGDAIQGLAVVAIDRRRHSAIAERALGSAWDTLYLRP